MFKKLLLTTAVLAVSTSIAFAANKKNDLKGETAAAPCPSYTYLTGPYLGFSVGTRDNATGTPTVYKGIEGILSAGYGYMMTTAFYLGGEIFVSDSAKLKDFKSETDPDDGVQSGINYGLSLFPGYMITDHVLAYLRVGGTWTQFHDSNDHGNQTLGAWQAGLGAQTNVYQGWDVRAEYVYSGYNTLRDRGKVTADQFNVGVVYKFI